MRTSTRLSLWPLLLVMMSALAFAAPGKKSAKSAKKQKVSRQSKVLIDTDHGQIELRLFDQKTPKTVANFLQYVRSGFYEGLVFHRVIPGFMIQAGGYDVQLKPRQVRAPVVLEAGRGLSNKRGTVAMARTGDPNSATSQFFVNLVDNARLDDYGGGYAVFGEVIKGMDVVEAIAAEPTRPQRGHANAPVKPVVIRKITVE